MAMRSFTATESDVCPRCKGDGAVHTHIPNETQSGYGWAGFVPCPRCGGSRHVSRAADAMMLETFKIPGEP